VAGAADPMDERSDVIHPGEIQNGVRPTAGSGPLGKDTRNERGQEQSDERPG
jgi:hypothetical protein